MLKVVTVYPIPGRIILMAARGFIPVPLEGASVSLDSFWHRALQDGDVTLEPPAVAVPTQTAAPAVAAVVEPAPAQPAALDKVSGPASSK